MTQRDPLPDGRAAGPGALQACCWRRRSTRSRVRHRDLPAARGRHGRGRDRSRSPGALRTKPWTCPRPTWGWTFRTRSCRVPRRWCDDLDTVRRLEDAGAAAIVHALALRGADHARSSSTTLRAVEAHSESFAEALSYSAEPRATSPSGPTSISSRSGGSRRRSTVPVIASLNGTTPGGLARVRPARSSRPAPTPWSSTSTCSPTDPRVFGAGGRGARARDRRAA